MQVGPLGQEDALELAVAICSCLENPMDRVWWATVHTVAESDMSRPCEHQVKLFLLYR